MEKKMKLTNRRYSTIRINGIKVKKGQSIYIAPNQIPSKIQKLVSKGLFVLANTAGYHRKGIHNSSKPRILLACGVNRKGIISKFLINLVAMIKFKVS